MSVTGRINRAGGGGLLGLERGRYFTHFVGVLLNEMALSRALKQGRDGSQVYRGLRRANAKA